MKPLTIVEALKIERFGKAIIIKYGNRELWWEVIPKGRWKVVEHLYQIGYKTIIETPNESEAVTELLKG